MDNSLYASYRYESSNFLSNGIFSFFKSEVNNGISGSGVNLKSKQLSLLAGLGEFLERETFISGNVRNKHYKGNGIYGYSFIQNKAVKIEYSRVFGNDKILADSCGMASHMNSRLCVMEAMREFIERQSYIFNYLSKSKGIIIDLDGIDKYKFILNKFEKLKFYNISLLEDYYVILSKAYHNGEFYVGLGASDDIDTALKSAIKELFQMKHGYKNLDKKRSRSTKIKEFDYSKIFFGLPTNLLINAYLYLDKEPLKIKYEDCSNKEFNLGSVIRSLNLKYEMDPLIVFIKPFRDIKNLKIAKVLDLNWFPNLMPRFYDDKVYDFVERVTNVKLDRACNTLPFP
jgi:hypothetical protein